MVKAQEVVDVSVCEVWGLVVILNVNVMLHGIHVTARFQTVDHVHKLDDWFTNW